MKKLICFRGAFCDMNLCADRLVILENDCMRAVFDRDCDVRR